MAAPGFLEGPVRRLQSLLQPSGWQPLEQAAGGDALEEDAGAAQAEGRPGGTTPSQAAIDRGHGAIKAAEQLLRRAWQTLGPRGVGLVAAAIGLLFVLAYLAGRESQQPTWEVTGLVIDYIDVPGISGMIPADTSRCPPSDPCGVADAVGCSVCPGAKMWNDGCACRKNADGHPAPSGEVVQADTTACPSSDPCGTTAQGLGCAKCPDDSWIREGCSCRQPPMSVKKFIGKVGDFFGSITGTSDTVIRMRIRASAEVHNPADVGARAEAGTFNISYRDRLIGSAATAPTEVGARSLATISADVKVDKVPTQVGMLMLHDILNDRTALPVQVFGSVLAVSGPFRIHCFVHCDLWTDVTALPAARFTKKACTYTYSV